jgi:energy-coupling factor transporter ATP-binding protein EcfA2
VTATQPRTRTDQDPSNNGSGDQQARVTGPAPSPASAEPGFLAWTVGRPAATRGIAVCLARLDEGVSAGRRLHLEVAEAENVRVDADRRLGFPSDLSVVALVGGTGVGKSTLLNTLAGGSVSEASARRPTTDQPVGWVPRSAGGEIDALLGWLGTTNVLRHEDSRLGSVALLDLPDLDSIEPANRARVEELLPRVDGVIWVTDHEKYRDAVLHDDFLRHWLPRLDRQLVVLNKSDRLGASTERVRRDLDRSLREDGPVGAVNPQVVTTAALAGEAEPVRGWLAEQVDAKRIVAGRIAASIRAALDDLAQQAGIDPNADPRPLLDADARDRAIKAANREILRLVDIPTAQRQAVAATRAVARPVGAGPIGWLLGRAYKASGRQARVADPKRFLSSWHRRGSLAPAIGALRAVTDGPLRNAPAAVRPVLAATLDAPRVSGRLRGAVDGAIAEHGPLEPPKSRLWPVIGIAQTLATFGVVLSGAWLVVAILLGSGVDTFALPVLGRVPIPFALLVGFLATGFILARVLSLHAGWRGRKWAKELGAQVSAAVEKAVADEAFGPLDRMEEARHSLWVANRGAREACGPQ